MKRGHALVLGQGLLAAVLLASVSWTYPGAWPTLAGLSQGMPLLLVLTASCIALGVADRGFSAEASVRTTVAMAFCVTAVLQPVVAVAVILVGLLVGMRGGAAKRGGWPVAEAAGRYAILVSVGWEVLARWFPSLSVTAPSSLPSLALLCVSAFAFATLDSAIFQLHAAAESNTAYLPLFIGGLQQQGSLLMADVSVAVISMLLYPTLRGWGFLMTVPVLLVMRQSFMLLVGVQSSYRSTIEALARAIEAYDAERRGHAESVASMATEAGRMLGMHGKRLRDLTYAALLHDAGLLGTDSAGGDAGCRGSAAVVDGVRFLAGVVPVLKALGLERDPASPPKERDLAAAYIIARCSELDSEQRMGKSEHAETAAALGRTLRASSRRSVDAVLRSVGSEGPVGPAVEVPSPGPQNPVEAYS